MTDPLQTAFSGDLKSALETYAVVCEKADAAGLDELAAEDGLRQAKFDDEAADVQAILRGGNEADDGNRAELAARQALDLARKHTAACERARWVALGAVSDATGDGKYAEKLAKDEKATTQTALNHLKRLEEALGEIAEKRALVRWLEKPRTHDDSHLEPVRPNGLRIGAPRMQAPNGELANSGDLVTALRDALEGADREPENPAASYGVPVGSRLVGPFTGTVPTLQDQAAGITFEDGDEAAVMTPGAQRAWDEMLVGGSGGREEDQ
jgi:hypothetical protein